MFNDEYKHLFSMVLKKDNTNIKHINWKYQRT